MFGNASVIGSKRVDSVGGVKPIAVEVSQERPKSIARAEHLHTPRRSSASMK